MQKENYENLLKIMTSTGCEYAEIYDEKITTKVYTLVDNKIDSINKKITKGISFRSIKDGVSKFIATNDYNIDNLNKCANDIKNYYEEDNDKDINLEEINQKGIISSTISHNEYKEEDKIKLLKEANEIARKYSDLVTQVKVSIIEYDKDFTIANSFNKLIKSTYSNTRFIIQVTVEENNEKESAFNRFGSAGGYEGLKELDVEKLVKSTIDEAVDLLHAEYFEGGEFPVIISNGFGAVIFHEACGHGLEATSVANKTSCFADLLNQEIASPKVTLIDDGTLTNTWGSINIDDEGNKPNKNILIENGILKSYLVDYSNASKMNNHHLTGSARREDYTYEPTSRMTNTYLEKGTDSIEDMIKSIDYGVYCYNLGGGLVDPASGNFNFNVSYAKLIENGQVTKTLKGLCLIGNSKDILNKVEMVSDDLQLADGYCGSLSGSVPVTIGQPTIKISKMQVGGKSE